MKNAILIHGNPSKKEFYDINEPTPSNAHWFPWLTRELMMHDIHTISLEMPLSFEPQYKIWKKELERYDINDETILVGHSCWGWFLLRWLSENPYLKTNKIVLVAPWLDPFWEIEEKDFFNFTFDLELCSKRDIIIFHSDDDMKPIQVSLKKIQDIYPDFRVKYFQNYGHFCKNDLWSEVFSELLSEIIK